MPDWSKQGLRVPRWILDLDVVIVSYEKAPSQSYLKKFWDFMAPFDSVLWILLIMAVYRYGLDSYALYSYGLYRYGIYS